MLGFKIIKTSDYETLQNELSNLSKQLEQKNEVIIEYHKKNNDLSMEVAMLKKENKKLMASAAELLVDTGSTPLTVETKPKTRVKRGRTIKKNTNSSTTTQRRKVENTTE